MTILISLILLLLRDLYGLILSFFFPLQTGVVVLAVVALICRRITLTPLGLQTERYRPPPLPFRVCVVRCARLAFGLEAFFPRAHSNNVSLNS